VGIGLGGCTIVDPDFIDSLPPGPVDAGDDDDDMGDDDDDDGGDPPEGDCSPTTVRSPCDHEASIIRVRAALGEGMEETTGQLVANFFHYRLGGGSQGGVPHNSGVTDVTISPTRFAEVHWDHCTNGEMWSEENCEYNLWVFLDLDRDLMLDPGEAAGRVFTEISCFSDAPLCETVVLDCLDGMSCATFADPGACECSETTCSGVGRPERIITCGSAT